MQAGPAQKDAGNWFGHRRSGVLLPLDALASEGAYALGDNAARFLQFLAEAGFGIWQMLPVHPPDAHRCPFQSHSLHAGSPDLLSLDWLYARDWMQSAPRHATREPRAHVPPALSRFDRRAGGGDRAEYESFKVRHAPWLEDYALYSAIRAAHGGRPWWEWPAPLRVREAAALQTFASEHASLVESYRLEQFLFFEQWRELRAQARERDVLLVGDIPFYAAHDSADVWARPDWFKLDASGQPLAVGGVPPDYFSRTGQRWANPLYDWERTRADGFRWWIERVRTELTLFDAVKLDHFRGMEAVWEIPADSPTAERGEWRAVPGRELLEALVRAFPALPFIAEDLGVITPAVEELRRSFGIPGMKVLQFAFDGAPDNPYLPHRHEPDYVVYTGTHDNNTTLGWFNSLDEIEKARMLDYLRDFREAMPRPMVDAALASVCRFAIVPMQDLLGLDGRHRINTPGTTEGNWRWRLQWEWIAPGLAEDLRRRNERYGRTG